MNNEKMEAFYNHNGEIIGTSRNANIDVLPLNVKRDFAKKSVGYTVKEAIRFEGADESVYYVSAENEKGTVIFRIEDAGYINEKK